MKLLKLFSLLLFLFSISTVFGQTVKASNTYVQNNINLLNSQLTRNDKQQLKLSDAQALKLEKVFAEKETKFNKIITKYKEKGELGEAFAELDKEYNSKIESVLNNEQKEAYRAANQKSVMKKQ